MPRLGAQATEYPHAFPRKGVTQLIDNPRVTVWEVNWRHGDEQPVHRHLYDMAGVYLRFGTITVTDLEGKANTGAEFPVPRPYFQVKGITHREEARAPGTPERLAIMVDLKDAVTDTMMVDDPEPSSYPREGARNVLENQRVRMWDYTYPAERPGREARLSPRRHRSGGQRRHRSGDRGAAASPRRACWPRSRRATSRAAPSRPSRR